ncbi:MAG: lipocalin family protein [Rikenellaceae bacterium]|nr:lipocalin family protein [Rikenellaceae bacterium]
MEKKNLAWGVGGALLGLGVAGTLLYYRHRPTIPAGVEAVKPFNAARYLGRWYEICRMPMPFESGLSHVTADYSLNEDGSLKVVNTGFSLRKGEWSSVTGKAVFVGDRSEGKMKVSFFGPFYAGYNVVEIDDDYRYALVFGRSLDYMWILSREPEVPEKVLRRYLKKAVSAGYDYYRLIWTEQEEF